MDFNLNEPEKMVQSLARDFAEREVSLLAAEIDMTGRIPVELAREMGQRGLLGL